MPRHLNLIALCTFLVSLGFDWPVWYAQEPAGFAVEANEAEVDFPDSIAFHLSATVPAPVASAELLYGVERVSCREASSRAAGEVAQPQARHVSVAWTWELRRSGSLPPGTRVWWQWQLVTEQGVSWTTPVSWLSFDDDRHVWKTETQGDITVHWYSGDREFGQRMLQVAVEAQSRLTADPGAELEEPVNLYFYADAGDLKASVQFAQSWTGGLAFPDYYTILIAAGPEHQMYGQRTVAHELMHLVVRQLTFNCSADIPRWLDEGLASWAEGAPDERQDEMLAEAIGEDTLLSLRSISSSFSAHATQASLAYAESQSVVSFLIERYGRERILDLLAAFRAGATYDGALAQVYGLDTDGLEDAWRAEIGAAPRPTPVAARASPTPVPTRALWGASTSTPVPAAPTPAASPLPSATTRPAATATPVPTESRDTPTVVAREPSPTLPGAREARPTPIGGLPEAQPAAWPLWAVFGTVGVVAVVSAGMLLARRR